MMAEAINTDNSTDEVTKEEGASVECPVCLQPCIHPTLLPCGHIFCFLCLKGVANNSRRCAMCRREIPTDFFIKPKLLELPEPNKVEATEDGYQWFYEGKDGWWQYDERTFMELEAAYKAGERTCELLVAGIIYIIDFNSMLQLRRNNPSRRRRIKRDHATTPKKGIAGLIMPDYNLNSTSLSNRLSPSPDYITDHNRGGTTTPVPPSNTPQTPAGGRTSGDVTPDCDESLHRAIDQIRSLNLRDIELEASDSDQ